MKVLAIGNSFSRDATRYLHQISRSNGIDITVANLFFGGCSLQQHMEHINGNMAAYEYDLNGVETREMVTIEQAIKRDDWQLITLQQSSPLSVDYATYQPWLTQLAEYVRSLKPGAELLIHSTWGYKAGSDALVSRMGYSTPQQMYSHIKPAYESAAVAIGATKIIPVGEAMKLAVDSGLSGELLHRDDIHLSFSAGRYLAGAVWYEALTGYNILDNGFTETESPIAPEIMTQLKSCAHKAVTRQ